MLSIDIEEAYLENKINKFINDISKFNNKHIIKCFNKTIFNIPEEPRSYHPGHQLDSSIVKTNKYVISTRHSN